MDMCLSTSNDAGVLAYRSLSPCIKESSMTVAPGACADDEVCDNNNHDGPWRVAVDAWESKRHHGGEAGLARDGHVIYGPYNADGEIWSCDDHDICNGVFFEND